MLYNPIARMTFGALLAEREGVDRTRALQLGVVAYVTPSPLVGVVLAQQLAVREVAAATPAPAPTPPPTPAPTPTPTVKMPDLTGRTVDQARAELDALKLQPTLTAVLEDSLAQADGLVFHQQPAKDTDVSAGVAVTVKLARNVAVPNVRLLSRTDAENTINAQKLRVGKVTGKDQLDRDTIVAQQPDPATPVLPNSTVDLTVWQPPATTPAAGRP